MRFDSIEDLCGWVKMNDDHLDALAESDDEYAPVARIVRAYYNDEELDPEDVAVTRNLASDNLDDREQSSNPGRLDHALTSPPPGVRPVSDYEAVVFTTLVARQIEQEQKRQQEQDQPAGGTA